jgi:hypothetical protein
MPADVLQEYMGHSKIATTLEFYSQRDEDHDVRARWALDALMKGTPMQDLNLSAVQSDVQAKSDRDRKAG